MKWFKYLKYVKLVPVLLEKIRIAEADGQITTGELIDMAVWLLAELGMTNVAVIKSNDSAT